MFPPAKHLFNNISCGCWMPGRVGVGVRKRDGKSLNRLHILCTHCLLRNDPAAERVLRGKCAKTTVPHPILLHMHTHKHKYTSKNAILN